METTIQGFGERLGFESPNHVDNWFKVETVHMACYFMFESRVYGLRWINKEHGIITSNNISTVTRIVSRCRIHTLKLSSSIRT